MDDSLRSWLREAFSSSVLASWPSRAGRRPAALRGEATPPSQLANRSWCLLRILLRCQEWRAPQTALGPPPSVACSQ